MENKNFENDVIVEENNTVEVEVEEKATFIDKIVALKDNKIVKTTGKVVLLVGAAFLGYVVGVSKGDDVVEVESTDNNVVPFNDYKETEELKVENL